MSAKSLWRWAIFGPASLLVLSTMCVWPGPRWRLLEVVAFTAKFIEPFLALALLAAIPAAIYFLIAGLVKRRERDKSAQSFSQLVPCVCMGTLGLLTLWGSEKIRHTAFERAAETGNDVLTAIDRFKNDDGAYPDNLERLVPKYLAQVPSTGLIGYPDFYYCKRGDPACRIDSDAEYELGIRCPSGGVNWDVFFFWPDQDYPVFVYGGGVERIGKWAYVHE